MRLLTIFLITTFYLPSHSEGPPLSDKISRLEAFQKDPQKKTVCSLTLNSTNEANTFSEKLDSEKFQFVEIYERMCI